MMLHLTDEHQRLLPLLGKLYAWLYRYKCIHIRPAMRNVGYRCPFRKSLVSIFAGQREKFGGMLT
jgi:hypothetical protein